MDSSLQEHLPEGSVEIVNLVLEVYPTDQKISLLR